MFIIKKGVKLNKFEFVFVSPEVENSFQQIKLLNGVQVLGSGYFPKASGHDFNRTAEPFTVVIFCTAGKGYYEYKNKIWEVNAGDILYCWHSTQHHYWADKENPWTIFWLHVQGKEIDLFLGELNLSLQVPVLSIGVSPLLISFFREILDIMKKETSKANSLYASSLARQLLASQVYLISEKNKPLEEDYNFNKILKYFSDHLNETISITEMANYCHLSKTYFIRKFQKKFGYSPLVYFNRLKIESACHLLLISKRSIKEIAFAIGFNDPLYFSRLFQKVMKKSPSDYRSSK